MKIKETKTEKVIFLLTPSEKNDLYDYIRNERQSGSVSAFMRHLLIKNGVIKSAPLPATFHIPIPPRPKE